MLWLYFGSFFDILTAWSRLLSWFHLYMNLNETSVSWISREHYLTKHPAVYDHYKHLKESNRALQHESRALGSCGQSKTQSMVEKQVQQLFAYCPRRDSLQSHADTTDRSNPCESYIVAAVLQGNVPLVWRGLTVVFLLNWLVDDEGATLLASEKW